MQKGGGPENQGAALAAPPGDVYISLVLSSPEDPPPPSTTSAAAATRGDSDPPHIPPDMSVAYAGTEGWVMRYVFYFLWIFAVPFALAVGNVWLLTPAPGALSSAGALRVFVARAADPPPASCSSRSSR